MNIIEKLNTVIEKNNSLVCVGFDSDIEKIPVHLRSEKYPQFVFNKAIIDATAPFVCAYKPNSAFYEARGEKGLKELKMTFDYIRSTYPEIVTILDGKRADIGSTNKGYVTTIFDYFEADATTLQPYLGREAIQPFLDRKDKGCIVLCRTSNPGAGEFQDLVVVRHPGDSDVTSEDSRINNDSGPACRQARRASLARMTMYQYVAQQVAKEWNANKNCMLVVGATYPEGMKKIRLLVGDMPFLVPGIGEQGGNLEKILHAGLDSKKRGMIINSSRGIIFASKGKDFTERAKEETQKLRDEINKFR